MLYANKGYIRGTLARDPYKVAEGVVLLTLRVRDERVNPATGRREFHFPTFVVFGRESDRILKNLVKNQEVALEYKLETRNKEINGERRYFEDKVVTKIVYGRKPEVRNAAAAGAESKTPKNETTKEEKEAAKGVLAKIIEEGMKNGSNEEK